MNLLDVNALVALAWDSHVHHEAVTRWFDSSQEPWCTCAVTEAGFVRVSANPLVLPGAITVADARHVLRRLRGVGDHRFLVNDVSQADPDLEPCHGHRQVTDLLLLAVARRAGANLLTFDASLAAIAGDDAVLLER